MYGRATQPERGKIIKLFYDCEFLEDGNTISLISIGMVADDGREYYAVNANMPLARIASHEWLRANVVPHLPITETPGCKCITGMHLDVDHPFVRPRQDIARQVRDFILATPDVELWAYYGAYDHVALCQLWGRMMDLPPGVPMYTNDIKQEAVRLGYPRVPVAQDGEHNALADARHNKAMAEFLARVEAEATR